MSGFRQWTMRLFPRINQAGRGAVAQLIVALALLTAAMWPACEAHGQWVSFSQKPPAVTTETTHTIIVSLQGKRWEYEWCEWDGGQYICTWMDPDNRPDSSTFAIMINGVNRRSDFTLTKTKDECYWQMGDWTCDLHYDAVGTITVQPGDSARMVASVAPLPGANPPGGSSPAIFTFRVIAGEIPGVAVRAQTPMMSTGAGQNGTAYFTLTNYGNVEAKFNLSAFCTGAGLDSGVCNRQHASRTVGPGASTTTSVNFKRSAGGGPGTIRLIATHDSLPGVSHSDGVGVGGVPSGVALATVAVDPALRSATRDKAECLIFAVVRSVANECGVLRVTHALPAVRTFNTARAPTLVYYADQLPHSTGLLVDVRRTASAPRPDSVRVQLEERGAGGGYTTVNTIVRPGSALRDGGGVVVVPWAKLSLTETTLVGYRVTTSFKYGGTWHAATSSPLVGEATLVRRHIAAGWHVAGLEDLPVRGDSTILWVGGDGSTRKYTRSGSLSGGAYSGWRRFVAPGITAPDSLIYNGTNEYRRRLSDGAWVVFDAEGRHVKTERPHLGSSRTTNFGYAGTSRRLTSVSVAPSAANLTYQFHYGGDGVLDSISAPGTSSNAPRVVKLSYGSRSTRAPVSISGPDAHSVSFTLSSTGGHPSGLITAYRDRRLTWTTLSSEPGAWHLRWAETALEPGTSRQTFQSAWSGGGGDTLTLGMLAAGEFRHDGAMVSHQDITRFYLNVRGAPDSTVDALGGRTRLYRDSTSLPGLVTRVVAPNGFTTRASYNARGHLVASIAEHPYGSGGGAPASVTTTYTWDSLWNAVTRINPPMGPATARKYNAATGLLEWELTGSDSSRKAHFAHDVKGQLQAITVRDTVIERFWYDDSTGATQNTRRVENALGVQAELELDRLGRVTRTYEPRPKGSTETRSYSIRTYDVMDRVTGEVSWGPGRPDSAKYSFPAWSLVTPDTAKLLALTLTVSMSYDAEGNQTSMTSYSSGDSDAFVNATTVYDRLNRVVSQTTGSPRLIYYDPAGNVDSLVTPNGSVVRQRYDALGRVVQRILPSIDYPEEGCAGLPVWPFNGHSCPYQFPYYSNSPGGGYLASGDTLVFEYDVAGNQIRADNRGARIRRGYWPNGQLRADTTRMSSTWANPRNNNITRVQTYTYDLLGRPVTMQWAAGTTAYLYEDTHTGSLSGLDAPDGTRFRWYFDRWGRDTLQTVGTIAQPSRITERRAYDLLGQQIYRDRRSQAFSGGGGILMDSLFYDHRGKIGGVWTSSRSLGTERYSIHYDGLGALVASLSDNGSAYSLEEFRNDAYGNVLYSRTRSSAHGDRLPSRSTYMGKGHLNRRWTPTLPGSPPPQIKYEDLHQEYVGDNLRSSASVTYDPNEEDYKNYAGTRHYYDGENRLAALQRYTGFPAYMDPVSGWYWSTDGTFEEYRYDALGRRVMTQVRRAASPPSGKVQLCEAYYSPTNCRSYLEHTWWAGDQMFEESRTPIGPSDASNSGTVRYVHGPGIDRPLAVLAGSTHIVNYTWRGLGESSLTPTGAAGDCSLGGGGGCTLIDWPVDRGVYFTKFYASSGPQPVYKWMGTLTANGGSGTTGLLYRRNRYYDSETGRWTQEDPIGIAGGINVFGFAAGDPVNYTDPFGLSKCPPECFEVFVELDRMAPAINGMVAEFAVNNAASAVGGSVISSLFRRAATRLGAIAATRTTQELSVTFGRNANQIHHAFRHTDELGLSRSAVQNAVRSHLPSVVDKIPDGRVLNQVIEVSGQRIQYSAFRLPDGSINIGRIHGIP